MPRPRKRKTIIWILKTETHALEKKQRNKKNQTNNKKKSSDPWQLSVILQRKRDNLSAIQGLWCLFPADFLGDRNKKWHFYR